MKWFRLRSLYIFFLVTGFLILHNTGIAQKKIAPKIINKSYYADSIQVFDSLFSNNKHICDTFRTQILIALSYYPELKDAHIQFARRRIKTTMACRPKWTFFLKPRDKRVYLILINKRRRIEGVLLRNVPFNAQIGVIGHELGHVVDYSQKGFLRIAGTGIGYLFRNYRRKLEATIDRITIAHGLGWQVYDFADFVMNRSDAPKSYKRYKRKNYLSPLQIKKHIRKTYP